VCAVLCCDAICDGLCVLITDESRCYLEPMDVDACECGYADWIVLCNFMRFVFLIVLISLARLRFSDVCLTVYLSLPLPVLPS